MLLTNRNLDKYTFNHKIKNITKYFFSVNFTV